MDHKLGPINDRDVFPKASRVRAALQRQRGWVNPYIPKNERERQRPFDEHLRSNLGWQKFELERQPIAGVISYLQQRGGTNHKKKEWQDQEWLEEW